MDVYGLVGNPVGHSLSPPMHEAAYEARELDATYVTFEPDVDVIHGALAGAEALGIEGLNVTIPFKQDALEAVEPGELAARIGAVNTIDFTGEGPVGHNTDAAGVTRAFAHHDVRLRGADAVVVGAGGAGRAAAFALRDAGASVHVANRTVDRAEALVADLRDATRDSGAGEDPDGNPDSDVGDDPAVTAGGLDTLSEAVPGADILVNATSVGMESDETPVEPALLHGELAVLDAVYAPLRTRLLRAAAEAGATTIDGAWMLLYQGVEAFEIWTGEKAPVTAMNEALRSRL
ncbi:MAG: shikimate dehydrogenase [Haloferacaceae archaeon]